MQSRSTYSPSIYLYDTVSLGKGSGSKGKQHYKRTASQTKTHNQ